MFDISNGSIHPFDAGPLRAPEWDTYGKVGFSNTTGRTPVATYMDGISTIVLLVLGQSNAINGAPLDAGFTPVAGVHNYNFYDGKTYVAVDPLLGAETTDQVVLNNPGSCFATKLGSMMIQAGMAERVIIANMAIGGAASYVWLTDLYNRPRFVLRSMQQAGIKPDFVLQMFGESDNIEGIDAANLTIRLRYLIEEFRRNGCDAPYFVSQTAKYQGATNDAAIRLGQANTWSDALGIYQGPDTDSIGNAYRAADQTHFTAAGNTQHAMLWLTILQNWIAAHNWNPS